MKRTTVVEIIALLFCVLFLYTGVAKLIDYDVAVEQIALTPLLEPIASMISIGLPILEIITAALLFIPETRKKALYASLFLMISFTGYIIYILNYNAELPCTCGGILQQMTWPQHLVFNSAFILFSITGILLSRNRKIMDQKTSLAHS